MTLTIGQLAESSGVGIETLRFYEREGLIETPARTRSGYRNYDASALARLTFIRRAQALGFSLKEIRELIDLHASSADCATIGSVAEEKVKQIQQKIDDLERMRDSLRVLVKACKGGSTAECSVVACFTGC